MTAKPGNIVVHTLADMCEGRYKGKISFKDLLDWGVTINLIYINENSRPTTGDVNVSVLEKVNTLLDNVVHLQGKVSDIHEIKVSITDITRQLKRIESTQKDILGLLNR